LLNAYLILRRNAHHELLDFYRGLPARLVENLEDLTNGSLSNSDSLPGATHPSPDVLTRLLESNRKSIRIPLHQDTGDPLHAAFEIVQQLALQGYPVPLSLLLLRKSFLTLDGITRQLDPDFNAWLETLAYASGVFASEAVVRTWSILFLWLDRPDFYRSGLPVRTLARTIPDLCKCTKLVDAFWKSVRCFIWKLRNHPEPSQRKQRKEVRKKHEY